MDVWLWWRFAVQKSPFAYFSSLLILLQYFILWTMIYWFKGLSPFSHIFFFRHLSAVFVIIQYIFAIIFCISARSSFCYNYFWRTMFYRMYRLLGTIFSFKHLSVIHISFAIKYIPICFTYRWSPMDVWLRWGFTNPGSKESLGAFQTNGKTVCLTFAWRSCKLLGLVYFHFMYKLCV